MANRFEERLANGPVIVGDGGMGALITSAVPRLRCPEEANLRAPDAVVSLHVGYINAGADLIETNSFGANRRKLARPLPRGRARADQLDLGEARPRGAGGHRPRRLHRRLDRPARRAGRSGACRAELFAEQADDPRGPRRRPPHGRDVLRPRGARRRGGGDRAGLALPIVALIPSTGRRHARRRHRAGGCSGWPTSTSPPSARTTAPACWPPSPRLSEMDGDGASLAALPNIGLASLAGGRVIFPHARPSTSPSSPRTRASSARGSSAAAAGRPRPRSPRSGRQSRRSASRARRSSSRSASSRPPSARSSARPASAGAARRRVDRLGPARPSARRQQSAAYVETRRRR